MARRGNSSRARPGARSEQVESKLGARHITFKFVAELPVADIRDAEGNQVRRIDRRAPKELVARYAEQMKAGAVFPAIVVNDRLELVDGNTRRGAAERIGLSVIAAYVCEDLSALEARSMSVELNQMHGLAMSEDEIRAFVAGAVDEGQMLDTDVYARMTGIPASALRRWTAAAAFRIRAKREGLSDDDFAALTESCQAALTVAHLTSVFLAATSLAAVANVPATQVRKLITRANAAASEADALATLASEREARRDDITAVAAGFKRSKKRRGRTPALHIAGLLKLQPDDFLDVDPERRAESLERFRAARDQLSTVIARAETSWGPGQAEPEPPAQPRGRATSKVAVPRPAIATQGAA